MSIQEVAFQNTPVEKLPAMSGSTFDSLRPWITPAVALLIVLFFLRQLKRTPPDPIPLEVLDPAQALVMDRAVPTKRLENRRGAAASSVSPEMLNEMIRQKPDNVSVALREWMTAKP